MDLNKMIAELQAERERLDEAILALERLVASKGKRRGRPPKWLTTSASGTDSSAGEPAAATESVLSRAAGKRG